MENNANKNVASGAERFISLVMDGTVPLSEIVRKLWCYINASITDDDEESEIAEQQAKVIGWVLGLDEDEVDCLIRAECIKQCVLKPSIDAYNKKRAKRVEEMAEKTKKRKEEENTDTESQKPKKIVLELDISDDTDK